MIEFTIPGEARGKQRPRATKQGRVYTPKETRNNEAFIRMIATAAMAGRPPLEGAVIMTIDIRVGIPKSFSKSKRAAAITAEISPTKKPDVDNCAKQIADSINGIVYEDDKQIVLLVVGKKYHEQPGTTVTVTPARKP